MRFAQPASTIFIALATPALAQAAEDPPEGDTIIVTAPGGLYDRDEAETIDAADIRGSGRPDLFQALARSIPALSLQEAQNNPFQPNLVYRGFTASPLQGQAQGLAVYLDGGRFNQPFGDTVQFDLLPEAAIERLDLLDADPVYGLNALGGAIVVATKTGRSAPGLFLSGSAGAFGESEAVVEGGWSGRDVSAYVAIQRSRDGGWRRFSPSSLSNGFADLGWDGDKAGVHLKLVGADTDLTGNGSAPVELLKADYRAVFTHPDTTRNRYARASLHPWLGIAETTRLEGTLYLQDLRQRTLNGDAADIEACDDEEQPRLLCIETAAGDEEALLIGAGGRPVPDALGGEEYGVLNRSRTRTRSAGIIAQLVDRRPLGAGENLLIVGLSHDRSHTRFRSSSELGALTEERSVDGLGTIIAQPDGSVTPVSLIARTSHTGLFLSERLPITGQLTAEIGLRWNRARIELDDRLGTALDGSHQFRRLNPGAELDWQLSPRLTLRAGYAEANRAPTPAELACADEEAPCSLTNFFVADPPLRQVVARSLELGGRGKVGPVEWFASAFRTTNSDDIHFVASDVRGRAFFRNIGRTRRQGVEIGLGYARGGLSLRGGYALTEATFRTPLLLNSPDNPAADENGQIQVHRGDRLPGIPRHRAVLSAVYDSAGWSLGAHVQASSGQHLFGDEANLQRRTDPYAIANIRGSVRLWGPVHLFGEVRNLFNSQYATFGAFGATDEVELDEAAGASDPRTLGPGAPRRWTAGLKARF